MCSEILEMPSARRRRYFDRFWCEIILFSIRNHHFQLWKPKKIACGTLFQHHIYPCSFWHFKKIKNVIWIRLLRDHIRGREGGVTDQICRCTTCTFECTRTCSLMETLDMWYLRETSDCALDRSYHDSMVSTSVLGATALWKFWVDFLRRGKKVRQQLLAPGAPSWVGGR